MICTLSPSSMIRSTNSAAMSFFRQRMRVENQTDAAVQNGSAHAKAAQVRRAAKNRLRRDLSRQKRQSNVKISNLVKDEKTVRPRGRRRRESFPAQSAPPVRDGILSRIQGHRQAGGCSWAFEHRNDANLPCHKCGRASASARTAKTCIIKTESIFRICKGSETISSLPLLVAKYSTIFRQRQGKL